MGVKVLNLRDAVMRIIDGTANTPNYVTVLMIDGTLGPIPTRGPRATEFLVVPQGKADANMHRVIEGDGPIYEPYEMSLSILLEASINSQKVLSAMSNPFNESSWQPDDATTFSPVTTLGARINGDGTSVTCAGPADSERTAGLVNVEIFATNPDGSGDDFGIKLAGVYFVDPKASFANPTGSIESSLEVYGAVTDLSAGFSTPVNEL